MELSQIRTRSPDILSIYWQCLPASLSFNCREIHGILSLEGNSTGHSNCNSRDEAVLPERKKSTTVDTDTAAGHEILDGIGTLSC